LRLSQASKTGVEVAVVKALRIVPNMAADCQQKNPAIFFGSHSLYLRRLRNFFPKTRI
jgi:hypothetical protein